MKTIAMHKQGSIRDDNAKKVGQERGEKTCGLLTVQSPTLKSLNRWDKEGVARGVGETS